MVKEGKENLKYTENSTECSVVHAGVFAFTIIGYVRFDNNGR